MKKLFLGSAALLASGIGAPAAFAADMRIAAAPPPVPIYTWSGCYIGASAGTSNASSQHIAVAGSTFNNPGLVNPAGTGSSVIGVSNVIPAGTNITDHFNLSGFIGGFQGGCNWQWGAWIFGIEGDGSATNKSGQDFERPLVPLAAGSANWISQTQERWLVTARARLGWTIWDRTMVYVTGGQCKIAAGPTG